jgi:carbon-monoxide dehydrogenase small subunit
LSAPIRISLTVNGEPVAAMVPARMHLADFVRDELGLTGTHIGCEHGVCGACTIRLDGTIVRGCLVLAVQADGGEVETIEGVSDTGEVGHLQAAFQERNALQCGYCTPGMLLAAQELLKREPKPSRAAIREHMSGNYCRCTGYHAIIDAVEAAARARAGERS